jgi:glycine cleavage system aminomethyltransferase T
MAKGRRGDVDAARQLVRLQVDGLVSGGEPVRADGVTVGYITSGGGAQGACIAFAWLDREHDGDLEAIAFDRPLPARVIERR